MYRDNLIAAHKTIDSQKEEIAELQDEIASKAWERRLCLWKGLEERIVIGAIATVITMIIMMSFISLFAWITLQKVEPEIRAYTIIAGPVEIHPIQEEEILFEEEEVIFVDKLSKVSQPIIHVHKALSQYPRLNKIELISR